MCEFRMTPVGTFDPAHRSGGPPPNCVIRVHIRCLPEDCDETIEVVILDGESDEPLTSPVPLECDGEERPYDLPMALGRPPQFRRVVMRFRCCGQERDGEEDAIKVRCE